MPLIKPLLLSVNPGGRVPEFKEKLNGGLPDAKICAEYELLIGALFRLVVRKNKFELPPTFTETEAQDEELNVQTVTCPLPELRPVMLRVEPETLAETALILVLVKI